MKKLKLSVVTCLLTLTLSANSQQGSTNASAKATFQSSSVNVLKPFTSSTLSSGPITTPWQPVLQQTIKTANNWNLVVTTAFEVGLYTDTTVKSKNMVSDTSTATAAVEIRVLVDGKESAPGPVVFSQRTQQLTAILEGAIARCLSVITNNTGGLQILLDTNCVQPEVIGLMQNTMAANSFIFGSLLLQSGQHSIVVEARQTAMGDNQLGSFKSTALLGKGTISVEAVRFIKDPSQPYELN